MIPTLNPKTQLSLNRRTPFFARASPVFLTPFNRVSDMLNSSYTRNNIRYVSLKTRSELQTL